MTTALAALHRDCDHPAWCAATGLGDPEAAPVRRSTRERIDRAVMARALTPAPCPCGMTHGAIAPETELERLARDGDR